MNESIRILIVEDLAADAELAKREILKVVKDCEFQCVETREDYLEALETFHPNLILSDYHLPHFDGMKALKLALENSPLTPFIIWTGSLSEDIAVDCMRAGANNYIIKENIKRLAPAVIHALEERRLLLERTLAEEKYQAIFENSPEGIFQSTPEGRFISVNPAMARIFGYDSPQEMIESVTDISHQLNLDLAQRELFIGPLQTRGVIENFEWKNQRKDGSIIWISISARVVRDADGNVLYYEGFLQDITERKQAEEALGNNEKRFRALIENGLDNISLLAADGTLIWESPAVFRTLDYAPDEFLGQDIFKLMHPDDLDWTRNFYANIIQEPRSRQHGSFRLRHSNNTWRWVEAIVTNMLDEPGVNAIVVNYRDITERKQAEIERQALLEIMQGLTNTHDLQEFLKLLHHSIGRVIYAKNFFVVLNDQNSGSFEEIYSVDQYDQPEPPSKLEKSITSYVFRTGEPLLLTQARFDELIIQGEVELVGTNSASWMGAPLKTQRGTIGVLAVQDYENPNRYTERDKDFLASIATQVALAIERKRAEELLRESEERFSSAFEYASIGIALVAVNGRWLRVNQALCELVGYSEEELLEKTFQDITHPEDLETDLYNVRQILSGEIRSFQMEKRYFHKLGHVIWILLSVSLVRDHQGKPRHFISQIQDITERKRAEDELRASEERFIQLANNIQEVFWMTDAESGKEIYMSPAAEEVWGRSLEYLMDKPETFMNSVLPEDLPLISHALETERKGGKAEVEYRITRPDGTVRWIWDRAFPILDDTGRVKRIAGVSADITERKQAETRTRRHLAELEALYENGLAVGRLLKPSEIGDRMIETFARYLSWHHVAIRLKRPESDELELIALNQPGLNEQERAEMERHFSSMISKVDKGLSGWVIQTGQAVRTGNVHTHPQYIGTQEGIRSGLYMPLKIGERIIGSISVESEVADAFTAQDERLLATLSNQAAIAFENARLYQSAQQELAERKRLQEQLDREHAQLKALFETIPDPVWLKDPQGKYLACNPVLEELIDVPEAQILGKTDYDLLDEKLAEHFKAKDQEAIHRNVPMTYQEWVTYPNKQPRLVETVRTPMHDDRGSLIGVLGISHDITAMHNTQQELRESQELYRLLVETSPDGIGILGLDGTIIFANQQLADLFGMKSPFNCIGINFMSLVAPEEHPRITKYFAETMPDDVFLEEYWMARKDSSRFYGEARFSLSLDKAGQPRWIIGQIRDITESKTAQETIQEERQRFLDLFENTPVAIWLEDFSTVVAWMEQLRIRGVTDLKEYLTRNPDQLKYGLGLIRILSMNQAAVEMNGAHSKAHLLENFHQLVRDEAPSDVMVDELDMLWRGKTSFEFEMTSRRLDGTLTTGILHIYTPINNGKPDYSRVIIASTDISERVNTEKALQASETHYRELADSITDVFFEMDSDLHYIYWNKSSETLTGIMAKDAIGKSMRQIFGETEEQARIEKIYEDVFRNHQSKTFEATLTLENRHHIFEINAYPSTRGVSVVAKDVTDRKRSETIMQKRFELMEYSAHHSLNEVVQKTIDEVSQLTGSTIGFLHFVEPDQNTLGIQTWSTSALQQFSVPVSDGTHLPVDQAGVWADAVRARRSMIQNDYDSLPNKKSLSTGHMKIIREMVIPIIRNEKTVAVLGLGNRPKDYTQRDLEIAERFTDYAWDITERKQMEIALADERNQLAKRVEERAADLIRANTNLARALRVKDEFLANMSHELRTPLNAILGLSESLGEQIAGPLNEKQQKYITTISESGRHLLSLINDILDLAKIEAGQITLDINKVDIQSVCEASLRMIKQLAQNKHQDVTLEIDDEIGLIWADERRLKQMIVNLLSNAVKFTPEYGKIGLEVHGNKNENEVMIMVWDNGIGMKEKDLSRLFQPFVQLDSGLARETTGTGLGLALVAQMVRLHGGSVRVNSHPEQGSRFTIVLPWEPALAIDTASKMKITGKFRAVTPDFNNRPTVLLIEDTNEVIMMIRDYLELAGYQVVTAKDGVEGITQAQLIHPDLILMDVMMPRMDGLEATRRLRSEPEFAATPIIALTALAMPSDRERCISAGMNDYMSKPVNLKELVKTIQRFLVNTEGASS